MQIPNITVTDVIDKLLFKGLSIYEATNQVAKYARLLSETTHHILLESEILSCVVSDEIPTTEELEAHRNKAIQRKLDSIQAELYTVSNEIISRCVIKSVWYSLYADNLIYIYDNRLSDAEKLRVRILCSQIYDKLH